MKRVKMGIIQQMEIFSLILFVLCGFAVGQLGSLAEEAKSRRHRERASQTLQSQSRLPLRAGPFFISSNPLRDQPNLSKKRKNKGGKVIHGSRKAFSITNMEYLKKEWCKTERLKQVIREEGCSKRTIMNRFCYGQCNSFFIPKSNKEDREAAAFLSCGFCKPKKVSWITVTLRCPNRRPRLKRKRIQMIKQCKCMAQSIP